MAYVDTINKNSTDYALSAFGNVFINNQNANVAKTIDYSNRGFDQDNDVNLTVKVVFQNGHISADTTSNMTLNGKPILVNKDGALIKIPIQTLTEGGVTVYRTLQANTTLEMYYTKSVSGYSNGAYVVIGNPVVISSASYTIYADGYNDKIKMLNTCYPIGSIYWSNQNISPQSFIGGVWTRIYNCFLWACHDSADPNDRYANVNPNKFDCEFGEYTHKLTTSEMPSHGHTATQVPHSHSIYGGPGNVSSIPEKYIRLINTIGSNADADWSYSANVTNGVAPSITVEDTGGNQPHENMPPYLRRYCWERTA